MAHTKGKWYISKEDSNMYGVFAEASKGKQTMYVDTPIASVNPHNREDLDEDMIEANAKLIAAAPDLLSACRMAREELVFGGDWDAAKNIIDMAIKKATK